MALRSAMLPAGNRRAKPSPQLVTRARSGTAGPLPRSAGICAHVTPESLPRSRRNRRPSQAGIRTRSGEAPLYAPVEPTHPTHPTQ
jgi:hypothetical protein